MESIAVEQVGHEIKPIPHNSGRIDLNYEEWEDKEDILNVALLKRIVI